MPARTNARQRVIAMLQAQTASPGVTVTESKTLWDPVLEKHREVDVVVEDVVGGVPILVGIEVVDWSRPAGVPWVEQMIAKHERLGYKCAGAGVVVGLRGQRFEEGRQLWRQGHHLRAFG